METVTRAVMLLLTYLHILTKSSSTQNKACRTQILMNVNCVYTSWKWAIYMCNSVIQSLLLGSSVICLLSSCVCLLICLLINIYIAVNIIYKRKYQVQIRNYRVANQKLQGGKILKLKKTQANYQFTIKLGKGNRTPLPC